MAYEKTPVLENNPSMPIDQPIIMREEREVTPRRSSGLAKTASPLPIQSGQQVIKSERVATEEPVTPAETVALSPQMAALARKEQKFRREQQDLKAKEEALEKDRAEIAELKALKAKLEAKDYSGIENLVKYDDYTKYLIEKTESLTPEQQALKQLASEVNEVKQAQKDDVSKRFEAAVQERRKAVVQLVETNEDYSSIKELKMQEAVVQHILDTWEHDGIDLSPEEAAKEVEKELLDRAGQWSALSKLKSKTDPVDEKKQLPPLKAGIKTLTNNMTVSGEIKRPVKSFQFMNDSERYAEARRRAEEKLKAQRG